VLFPSNFEGVISFENKNNNTHKHTAQNKMSVPSPIIAPSILNADFGLLAQTCNGIIESGADWLHMDVMVCIIRKL
jgi:hypothetical protein